MVARFVKTQRGIYSLEYGRSSESSARVVRSQPNKHDDGHLQSCVTDHAKRGGEQAERCFARLDFRNVV